jgi:peptidoglycan/xylan/chitin deacetylase (PgdA/CDA1 family)
MFNGKNKALTFSFDDGVTQDERLINIFNKYGLKGTFNLNSELLGKNGNLLSKDYKGDFIVHNKVKPSEVKDLYKGHEVAVHTLTHPNLTMIEDDNEVIRQVEQDRLNLSELCGYEVIGMAYPCGGTNCNDRVAELIKNNTGVKYSRTIDVTGSFEPYSDLYQYKATAYHRAMGWDKMFELAREFVELKTDNPAVFYVWGHSYEFDMEEDGWEKIEKFCEILSGKDDVFYGTNKEILLK